MATSFSERARYGLHHVLILLLAARLLRVEATTASSGRTFGSAGATLCPPRYVNIYDEQQCRFALMELEMGATWNKVDESHIPAGCSYSSQQGFNFNSLNVGSGNSAWQPVCEPCGPHCWNCNDGAPGPNHTCLECADRYYLQHGECVITCPANMVQEGLEERGRTCEPYTPPVICMAAQDSCHGRLEAYDEYPRDASPFQMFFPLQSVFLSVVDFNNDGFLDVFAGTSSSGVTFYQNRGIGLYITPFQKMSTPRIDDGSEDAAPCGVDWDGDADVDLLIGDRTGGIRYYRNDGANSLTLAPPEENPFQGVHVGSEAIPDAVDWDGDGDLDLLVGSGDGRVYYYERVNMTGLELRPFAESAFYGINELSGVAPHAVDYDGDGDLDLLLGVTGVAELRYFERVASGNLEARTGLSNPFYGLLATGAGTMRPQTMDVNDDGLPDLLVARDSGTPEYVATVAVLRRVASISARPRLFTLNPLEGITTGFQAIARAGDWNQDGRPDVFVTDLNEISGHMRGSVRYFQQLKTGGVEERNGPLLLDRYDCNCSACLNGPGTTLTDALEYFPASANTNDCPGMTRALTEAECGQLTEISTQQGASFSMTPMPSVNRLDAPRGCVLVLEDEATYAAGVHFWNFNLVGRPNTQMAAMCKRCQPPISALPVDWDADGDMDLLLGETLGTIRYLERTGPAEDAVEERTGSDNPFDSIKAGYFVSPQAVDWDGDGDLDLLLGDYWGGLHYFHRIDNVTLSSPTELSDIRYQESFFCVTNMPVVILSLASMRYLTAGPSGLTLEASRGPGQRFYLVEDTAHVGFGLRIVSLCCGSLVERSGNIALGEDLEDSTIWRVSRGQSGLGIEITSAYSGLNFIDHFTALQASQPNGQTSPDWRITTSDIAFSNGREACDTVKGDLGQRMSRSAAADWDGDGDIDMILGSSDGRIRYFERQPDGGLTNRTDQERFGAPFGDAHVDAFAAPDVIDWNGDGNLELFVGQASGAILYYGRGTCSRESPCGLRGACSLRGECKCAVGYSGTDCSLCDNGYQKLCTATFIYNPLEEHRRYSSGDTVTSTDVATGTMLTGSGAAQSMLNSLDAWSPGQAVAGEWMDIDLGEITYLDGVVVQGRNAEPQEVVTLYRTHYSVDGVTWNDAADGHIIQGVSVEEPEREYRFPRPINARYVRFIVEDWQFWPSMRAGVLACSEGAFSVADCVACPPGRFGTSPPADLLGSEGCVTVGTRGVGAGQPCVFPFLWQGIRYQSCTDVDHDVPWCSTETAPNGMHMGGEWGDCSAACFVPSVDACEPCPAGRVAILPGMYQCVSCRGGMYPNADASECLDCPPGTYSRDPGAGIGLAASDCTPCPAGRVAGQGQAECTPFTGQLFVCDSGHECVLEGVQGNGFTGDDRIAVLETCGESTLPVTVPAELPNVGIAENNCGAGNDCNGNLDVVFSFSQGGSPVVVDGVVGFFDLCFCRPSANVSCELRNGRLEGFAGFFGRLTIRGPHPDLRPICSMNTTCAITGIDGVDLNAKAMVLLSDSCGANTTLPGAAEPLSVFRPNPDDPAYSQGGFSLEPFMLTPAIAAVSPELCFCIPRARTGNSDGQRQCRYPSDFRARGGRLNLDSCSPGFVGVGANNRCVPCNPGHYCQPGEPKRRCPPLRSTLGYGAVSINDCFCSLGTAWDARAEICRPCTPGRYQSEVAPSRPATCPELCPSAESMTSPVGAGSLGQCHCRPNFVPTIMSPLNCSFLGDLSLAQASASCRDVTEHRRTARVSVLRGSFAVEFQRSLAPGVQVTSTDPRQEERDEIIGYARMTFARALNVPTADVEVEAPAGGMVNMASGAALKVTVQPATSRFTMDYAIVLADGEVGAHAPTSNGGMASTTETPTTAYTPPGGIAEIVSEWDWLPDQVAHHLVAEGCGPPGLGALHSSVGPVVNEETLTCEENLAFPWGAAPRSISACACSCGYEPRQTLAWAAITAAGCSPCQIGFFKSDIGDAPCEECGFLVLDAPEPNNSNTIFRLSTAGEGSSSRLACECPAGRYTPPEQVHLTQSLASTMNVSGAFCAQCGAGHYCLGGTRRHMCPPNTTTPLDVLSASQVTDCKCAPGYTLQEIPEPPYLQCQFCPGSDEFKSEVGDGPCMGRCPEYGRAHNAAQFGPVSSLENCVCDEGAFWQDGACIPCTDEGVYCPGGLIPANETDGPSTGRRLSVQYAQPAPPVSRPGYYMVDHEHAQGCAVKMMRDGCEIPVCFGGVSHALSLEHQTVHLHQEFVCATGHEGLACGKCAEGFARNDIRTECVACSEQGSTLRLVGHIAGQCVFQSVWALFVACFAMGFSGISGYSDFDGPLIRVWLQWAVVFSVFQIDFDSTDGNCPTVHPEDIQGMPESTTVGSGILRASSNGDGSVHLALRWDFLPVGFRRAVNDFYNWWDWKTQLSLYCLIYRLSPTSAPRTLADILIVVYWVTWPLFIWAWMLFWIVILVKVCHRKIEEQEEEERRDRELALKTLLALKVGDRAAQGAVAMQEKRAIAFAYEAHDTQLETLSDVKKCYGAFGQNIGHNLIAGRLTKVLEETKGVPVWWQDGMHHFLDSCGTGDLQAILSDPQGFVMEVTGGDGMSWVVPLVARASLLALARQWAFSEEEARNVEASHPGGDEPAHLGGLASPASGTPPWATPLDTDAFSLLEVVRGRIRRLDDFEIGIKSPTVREAVMEALRSGAGLVGAGRVLLGAMWGGEALVALLALRFHQRGGSRGAPPTLTQSLLVEKCLMGGRLEHLRRLALSPSPPGPETLLRVPNALWLGAGLRGLEAQIGLETGTRGSATAHARLGLDDYGADRPQPTPRGKARPAPEGPDPLTGAATEWGLLQRGVDRRMAFWVGSCVAGLDLDREELVQALGPELTSQSGMVIAVRRFWDTIRAGNFVESVFRPALEHCCWEFGMQRTLIAKVVDVCTSESFERLAAHWRIVLEGAGDVMAAFDHIFAMLGTGDAGQLVARPVLLNTLVTWGVDWGDATAALEGARLLQLRPHVQSLLFGTETERLAFMQQTLVPPDLQEAERSERLPRVLAGRLLRLGTPVEILCQVASMPVLDMLCGRMEPTALLAMIEEGKWRRVFEDLGLGDVARDFAQPSLEVGLLAHGASVTLAQDAADAVAREQGPSTWEAMIQKCAQRRLASRKQGRVQELPPELRLRVAAWQRLLRDLYLGDFPFLEQVVRPGLARRLGELGVPAAMAVRAAAAVTPERLGMLHAVVRQLLLREEGIGSSGGDLYEAFKAFCRVLRPVAGDPGDGGAVVFARAVCRTRLLALGAPPSAAHEVAMALTQAHLQKLRPLERTACLQGTGADVQVLLAVVRKLDLPSTLLEPLATGILRRRFRWMGAHAILADTFAAKGASALSRKRQNICPQLETLLTEGAASGGDVTEALQLLGAGSSKSSVDGPSLRKTLLGLGSSAVAADAACARSQSPSVAFSTYDYHGAGWVAARDGNRQYDALIEGSSCGGEGCIDVPTEPSWMSYFSPQSNGHMAQDNAGAAPRGLGLRYSPDVRGALDQLVRRGPGTAAACLEMCTLLRLDVLEHWVRPALLSRLIALGAPCLAAAEAAAKLSQRDMLDMGMALDQLLWQGYPGDTAAQIELSHLQLFPSPVPGDGYRLAACESACFCLLRASTPEEKLELFIRPALRRRLLALGAPAGLATQVPAALSPARLGRVRLAVQELLFGGVGDRLGSIRLLSDVLQLGPSEEIIAGLIRSRLAALGAPPTLSEAMLKYLSPPMIHEAWPILERLLSADDQDVLSTLEALLGILGLQELLEPLLQAILRRKLLLWGAPVALADLAAHRLTLDDVQVHMSTFSSLIFQSSEHTCETLAHLFAVLRLGSHLEQLIRPALQRRFAQLGAPEGLCLQAAAALSPERLARVSTVLSRILFQGTHEFADIERLFEVLELGSFMDLLVPSLERRLVALGVASQPAYQAAQRLDVEKAGHLRSVLEYLLLGGLGHGHVLAAVEGLEDVLYGMYAPVSPHFPDPGEIGDRARDFGVRPGLCLSLVKNALERRLLEIGAEDGLARAARDELTMERLREVRDVVEPLLFGPPPVAPGRLDPAARPAVAGALPALDWVLQRLGLACEDNEWFSTELLGQVVLPAVEGRFLDIGAPREIAERTRDALQEWCQSAARRPKRRRQRSKRSSKSQNGDRSSKETYALRCECGNVFLQDSTYCRKCGKPRPKAYVKELICTDQELEEWAASRHEIEGLLDVLVFNVPGVSGLATGCQLNALRTLFGFLKVGDFNNDVLRPALRWRLSCVHADPCFAEWLDKALLERRPQEINRGLEPLLLNRAAGGRGNGSGNLICLDALEALLPTSPAAHRGASDVDTSDGTRSCLCCLTSRRLDYGHMRGADCLRILLMNFVRPAVKAKLQQLGVAEEAAEKAVASVTCQSLRVMQSAFEQLIFHEDCMEEMDKAVFLHNLGINLSNEELRRHGPAAYQYQAEAAAIPGARSSKKQRKQQVNAHQRLRLRNEDSRRYPVYGIFRNVDIASLVADSLPLWLIAVHAVWKEETRSLLMAIACDSFNLEGTTSFRWAGNTQEACFPMWSARVLFAFLGLGVWTIAFIVALYVIIHRHTGELLEPGIMHSYGFFYRGFEPRCWWWELLHKRVDSAIMMLVAYTGVVQDFKSKLYIYLAAAGFNLAFQEKFAPFERGGGGLPGSLETYGLWVRFLTLLIFMLASLSPEEGWPKFATVITVIAAFFLLLFVACIWYAISVEVARRGGRSVSRFGHGVSAGHRQAFQAAVVRGARGLFLGPVLQLRVCDERQRLAQEVAHIQWTGSGQKVEVVDFHTHGKNDRPWFLRKLFRCIVRRAYGLESKNQMALAARSMGQAVEAWLTNHPGGPGHGLPGGGFVDVLAVLALALQRAGKHSSYSQYIGREELVALLEANVDAVTHDAWEEHAAAVAGCLGSGDLTRGKPPLQKRRRKGSAAPADWIAPEDQASSCGPDRDLIRHAFTPEELGMAVRLLEGLEPSVARNLVRYILDRLGEADRREATVSIKEHDRSSISGPAGLRAAAVAAAKREGDPDSTSASRLEVVERPHRSDEADLSMLMFSGRLLLKGERPTRNPAASVDCMEEEELRMQVKV